MHYADLRGVKGAIKKMYADPLSIAGCTSPREWGIFHINVIYRRTGEILYFAEITGFGVKILFHAVNHRGEIQGIINSKFHT